MFHLGSNEQTNQRFKKKKNPIGQTTSRETHLYGHMTCFYVDHTAIEVRLVSLTCCDVAVVGSTSSPKASASLGVSGCCCLWSGDGVSWGRPGGGPGFCSSGFVKIRNMRHTRASMQTQLRRKK